MKLVVATHNQDKFEQIRAIYHQVPVTLLSLASCEPIPSWENTGPSFVEKALIKARHAAKYTGLPSISDDTGLSVDALGGAPGIHSSHYAGPRASAQENQEKILKALASLSGTERSARFYCAIAFVLHAQDPAPIICQAYWEGEILKAPLGTGGFGYDPIFYLPDHQCTVAQLSNEVRNQFSPRARALRQLALHLPTTDPFVPTYNSSRA